jgi:hypothetical protein
MNRRSMLLGAAGIASTTITSNTLLSSAAEASTLPVFLGRRKVDFLLDHDVFHVGGSQGWFKKIQFHVSGNDLFVYDLNVKYENGAFDDLPTRFKIPQGGFSTKLDLRHYTRKIDKVTFYYGKLLNGRGQTHVELWGWR